MIKKKVTVTLTYEIEASTEAAFDYAVEGLKTSDLWLNSSSTASGNGISRVKRICKEAIVNG